MACVALTSLMATIHLEFLQPIPRVSFHHEDEEATIKSFFENLSSLQAVLQKQSSGDMEIQIRDFALKGEDDIEIQLSNILLSQHSENREKASHELQTLREAAKNSTELLKILTGEKESGDMASVALTILMKKFQCYFLQPFPTAYLGDEASMISFFENLSSLEAFLQKRSSAIKKLETKIRNFTLKAEDDIEIQLSSFLLPKDAKNEEKASQELRQTLQEAAKIAAELLKIIYEEKQHEREREMTCAALTSLRATTDEIMKCLHDRAGIKSNLLKKLSSLQVFLQEESSAGSATTKDMKTTIIDFAQQLSNFFQAKETKAQDELSREQHQALQEATVKATELLKIITKEKAYHGSARAMASEILITFMKKFHYDFLYPTPIVLLDDKAAAMSFFKKLSSLQDNLLRKEPSGGVAIRYFVLKAEDDIETQIRNVIQAKDNIEYQEKASQLNQTVQEAAEKEKELLMIINSDKECDEGEIEKACVALGSLMGTIEKEFLDDEAVRKSLLQKISPFLEKISSLQAFLQKESIGGAAVKDLETKIKDFALKAGDDIKILLKNFLQAKDHKEFDEIFQELHQAVQDAAEAQKSC